MLSPTVLSPTVRRFAAVGVVNTVLDVVLFALLQDRIGIVLATLVSTSAGMSSSFVANGLVTFRSGTLTLRHAALFLATTGLSLGVVQPLLIHALAGPVPLLAAKGLALGVCVVLNLTAYRWVVWPSSYDERVSCGPRP